MSPLTIILPIIRKAVCCILVFSSPFANAQEKNHSFTIGNQQWMMPEASALQPAQDDTLNFNQVIFFKKESIDKYVPAGWRIPSRDDIRVLLASLEGTGNSTGGKTVDSAYLQKMLPFRLSGLYFVTLKRLAGGRYMTGYYVGGDTSRSFDSTGMIHPAQVALHVYRIGPGQINIEPTYAKLPGQLMYCQILFIKNE